MPTRPLLACLLCLPLGCRTDAEGRASLAAGATAVWQREFGDRAWQRRHQGLAQVAALGRREPDRVAAATGTAVAAGAGSEAERLLRLRATAGRVLEREASGPAALARLPLPTPAAIGQRIADALMTAVLVLQQGTPLAEPSDARHQTGARPETPPLPWWRRLLRRLRLQR